MISDRVKNCRESITLSLVEKIRKYKEAGESIINFGIGEPNFKIPDYICDAAKAIIDAGYTKSDAVAGVYSLRRAISKKLREDNGLDYSTDNIIINNGVKSSISVALQTILNPGDEVIVVKPYWVSYIEMIRLVGGVPVIADTQRDNQFKLTPDELIYAITPKTKAIILNTPTNPTGVMYSLDELLKLSEVLVRNNVIVISDEIFEEFVYGERKHISIASLNSEIKDLTIVVNGFSKTFAMTGCSLGYAAANSEIIDGMKQVQGHTISNPSAISQHVGKIVLEEKGEINENFIHVFDERRQAMIDRLDQIPGIEYIYPESTFYIFVDIEQILNNRKNVMNPDTSFGFCEKLLENYKVVVVPGEAFGMTNYLRFSFAAAIEDLDEGFNRISKFINQY